MTNRMLAAVATLGLILTTAATGCAKRAVAKVNGETITREQLVKELEDQQGKRVLDYLIMVTLVEQQAKEKKVKVTPEETKAYVNFFAERMNKQGGDFDKMLKDSGMTRADLEKRYRFQLLVGKMLMSDEDLKKHFEENQERLFNKPAEATYRRIIVKEEDEAEKVRNRIVEGDEDFGTVAKEVSTDTATKENGGLVQQPATERTTWDEKQKEFLFGEDTKAGDISEVVESKWPAGWMIMKLESRQEGQKVKYEDVKWEVWDSLFREKTMPPEQAAQTMIDDLKKEARLQIFDDRYKSILEEYEDLKKGEKETPPGPPGPPPPPPPPQ